MSRYLQLATVIELTKPKTIVEIGTWRGSSAVYMIESAEKFCKDGQRIRYIGYDLFEDANEDTDEEELNIKKHFHVDAVTGFIQSKAPSAKINLIKGNTRQTLNHVAADLCFIDGGHSLETIANDYEKCKGSKVIVMDDYYTPDEEGACPDLDKYGCNRLVDALPNKFLLPARDPVRTGGMTQMVIIFGGGE